MNLPAMPMDSFSTLVFLHPGWFWLLPALAAFALLARLRGRAVHDLPWPGRPPPPGTALRHPLLPLVDSAAQAPAANQGPSQRPGHRARPWRWLWRGALTWSLLTCLIAALAQPVRLGKPLPAPPRERSIVLIVDTSVSMVLRDYLLDGRRVARMDLLRAVLSRFVAGLHGDRVGLVVFADTAHLMLPLTRDHHLVQAMLGRLRTGIAGRASAPGDALALAIAATRQDPARRRILVLFTGVDRPGGSVNPLDAAALAAHEGLPVYTVAIGAGDKGAEEERTTGLIYQPVDLKLLRRIATLTGAQSYQAGAPDMLRQALRDISRREAAPRPPQTRRTRQPLYPWLLLTALGLWLLGRLSGERRRSHG